MITSEIVSKYKEDLKVIEVGSVIKTKKSKLFFSGLSGNLNVILPLAISQKDELNHCFLNMLT